MHSPAHARDKKKKNLSLFLCRAQNLPSFLSFVISCYTFRFFPSHGLNQFCLEKLLKCSQKCMFAEVLSLHDGPRRACNKPRYPVSYVNLRIMRNLKRENVLYMTFSVSVTVKSAFFSMHSPAYSSLPGF